MPGLVSRTNEVGLHLTHDKSQYFFHTPPPFSRSMTKTCHERLSISIKELIFKGNSLSETKPFR